MAQRHESDSAPRVFPARPVERLTRPFERFLHIEASAGLMLIAATAVALAAANSPLAGAYARFWNTPLVISAGGLVLDYPLWYWVNDALMAIFFFVVGLEIKRELVWGELRDRRAVVLPVVAALGGVLLPVAIFLGLQHDGPGRPGWAVPMATDIAFVVGCLALLGPRVSPGLKILLLSLAIIDDIIAVLVIAIFFTETVSFGWLAAAGAGLGAIVLLNRAGVRQVGSYTVVGAVVWVCTLKSGVHPTVAGVVLGLMTPASAWLGDASLAVVARRVVDRLRDSGDGVPSHARRADLEDLAFASTEAVSPLERLEARLHPWVGFAIMPIFALANAGIAIDLARLFDPIALAVAAGLAVGKPVGIVLAVASAHAIWRIPLPSGVSWPVLAGGGCLAGIGFTMALFLASLSLTGDPLDAAKAGILLGSGVSVLLGLGLLWLTLPAARPRP